MFEVRPHATLAFDWNCACLLFDQIPGRALVHRWFGVVLSCSFGRLSSGGYYWNLAQSVSFPNAWLFMSVSLLWWSLTCIWCCSFNRRHLWRSHKQFLHGRWISLVASFSLDLFKSHAWSALTLTLYVIIACFISCRILFRLHTLMSSRYFRTA